MAINPGGGGDENLKIQAELFVDPEPLQRSLSESERLLQQSLQRMAAFEAGQGDRPTVVSTTDGSAPLPPPQPTGGTPTQIQPPQQTSLPLPEEPAGAAKAQLDLAWEELKRIQEYSKSSPDVAMAALTGQGGLNQRVLRMGVEAGGEDAAAYQELINALKDLTGEVRKGTTGGGSDADPMTKLLGMVRANALFSTVSSIGQNTLNGNLFTAGGQVTGAGLGMLVGGPAGAMAGATIGGMIGGGADMLVNMTKPAQDFLNDRTDTAARFGDFSQLDRGLSFDSIADMQRSGYSVQETLGLIDTLRDRRVIDGEVDETDKALVESLQELTRATGINTQALVETYSTYRNLGGKDDPREYMAQVVAGAVDIGMQSNLQQYQEMMGSASQQLAYSSVSADIDGSGMRAVQGAIKGLMGGDSSTAALLRDNRALGSSMLQDFIDKGGAQQYSYQSIAMQNAGIDAAKTDAAYNTPEQRVKNAAIQYGAIAQKVFGDQDMGTLQQNISQNPDYLRNLISSDRSWQERLNVQFQAQFGKLPTAAEVATFSEIATNQIKNNGTIDLSMATASGDPLGKALEESNKTEADKAREAADKRATEQMRIFNEMVGIQAGIDKKMAEIYRVIGEIVSESKKLYTELKPAIDAVVAIAKMIEPLLPKMQSVPQAISGATTTIQALKEDPGKAVGALVEKADLSGIGQNLLKLGSNPIAAPAQITGEFLKEDPMKKMGDLMQINPILAPVQITGEFLKWGAGAVHDKFKDTPGPVTATEDYRTFTFEPGDVVRAEMGRDPGFDAGRSEPLNLNITQQFVVAAGMDPSAFMDAARRGAREGLDSFWDERDRSGGSSRRVGRNY